MDEYKQIQNVQERPELMDLFLHEVDQKMKAWRHAQHYNLAGHALSDECILDCFDNLQDQPGVINPQSHRVQTFPYTNLNGPHLQQSQDPHHPTL